MIPEKKNILVNIRIHCIKLYFSLLVVSICMSLSHFVMGVMKQSTCFIYCVFFPCKCRANMRFDLHVRVNMTKVKQTWCFTSLAHQVNTFFLEQMYGLSHIYGRSKVLVKYALLSCICYSVQRLVKAVFTEFSLLANVVQTWNLMYAQIWSKSSKHDILPHLLTT